MRLNKIKQGIKKAITIVLLMMGSDAMAQQVTRDTSENGIITVTKDPRLDILARKEAEFNSMGIKSAKGYRLYIIKSNDRAQVMKIRSQLLQRFPEHKPYMTFQAPFIKLKFGDFVEKSEAEKYRLMIMSGRIVTTNVYLVQEIVEVKPDKMKEIEVD